MRILVTGGIGFLGSHLVDRLASDGHEVYVLDNFMTGTNCLPPASLRPGSPGVKVVCGDVRDTGTWGILHALYIDRVYHLACPASPVHYQHFPLDTIETAFMGTRNLLQLAHEKRSRILITSTSEVYGDPSVSPQPETYWGHVNCYGPRSMYDEGKRASEALAWVYESQWKTDVRIARIFNTYGPRMASNDGRMVPEFILAALAKKPLPIMGTGKQTRSLCYVDDTIEGLVRLMESDVRGPVNIGNPVESTVGDVAMAISSLVDNGPFQPYYLPAAKDDPMQRRPDTTRAMMELGWSAKVEMREGLRKTIDWFRAHSALP